MNNQVESCHGMTLLDLPNGVVFSENNQLFHLKYSPEDLNLSGRQVGISSPGYTFA